MRSIRTGLVLAGLCLASPACFPRVEEERQIESRSYLRLVGRTSGAQATLRGARSYRFELEDGGDDAPRFAVAPDTYRVQVVRDGRLVLDRRVLIADGETAVLRVE